MLPSAPSSVITVRVLLFASYAEMLGRDAIDLALETPATVGSALNRLRSFPGAERLPPSPLCALNLSQVSVDKELSPGDQLAILPPMSGG